MRWSLFDSLVRQLGMIGYRGELALHGLNEPLLNPRLIKEYAQAASVVPNSRLTCYTNGDHLDGEILRQLIDAGVSRFRITLHPRPGAERDRFESGRARKRLLALLDRLGIEHDAVAQVPRRSGLRWIVERQGACLELDVPDVLAHFNDRGGLVAEELSLGSPRAAPCHVTSTAAAISYRGDVKMCCNVSPDSPAHERYSLGNLDERTFVEIWTSPKAQEIRMRHERSDWSLTPVCSSCRHRLPAE